MRRATLSRMLIRERGTEVLDLETMVGGLRLSGGFKGRSEGIIKGCSGGIKGCSGGIKGSILE